MSSTSISASSYHVLPRTSEDGDERSPRSRLFSTSMVPIRVHHTTSITIHAPLTIRILSTTFIITSFIILTIEGGVQFIAANIFLVFLMMHNILLVINYSITHIFKITIELRNWRHNVGNTERKFKKTNYLDVGLAVCLTISLVIGSGCKDRWDADVWKAGAVLGYFVVIFQALLAIPALENKSLTLTARLNDLESSKSRSDMKVLTPDRSAEAGSVDYKYATRSVEAEPTGEDLV